VAADKALIRSLNIPSVWELKQYRYEKFHELMKRMGLTTLTKPPDHFGRRVGQCRFSKSLITPRQQLFTGI
jgi:membrane carboxypeptidase/penicillin-binding protein PbpC